VRPLFGSLALGLLTFMLTACGSLLAPLDNVSVSPPPPSPETRDQPNRVDVHYRLNAPASVSSRILSATGEQYVLYVDAERPRPGNYVLQLDGTINGPGPNERRVLPDGEYQVVLDVASGDRRQSAQVPIAIRNADTSPPDVGDLAVLPDRISPDFDAIDDVTHISFRLAKDARVSAFLDRATDDGSLQRYWMGEEVKLSAGEQNITFDGMANGQPVPSGSYRLGVRARDSAGNVVERSQPLVVEDSGVPEASLVSVRIGPRQVIRGDEVCLDAIVRNTGATTLRTQGPDPGYVYNSMDSYSSIEDHRYQEHAGLWRVGLNWSASTDTSGATYPYRWGFGRDLAPGEEVPVHGCVKVMNEQDKLVYFAGLVQENVAIHAAGAGLVRIDISS
jgi:hypothetical protein